MLEEIPEEASTKCQLVRALDVAVLLGGVQGITSLSKGTSGGELKESGVYIKAM